MGEQMYRIGWRSRDGHQNGYSVDNAEEEINDDHD